MTVLQKKNSCMWVIQIAVKFARLRTKWSGRDKEAKPTMSKILTSINSAEGRLTLRGFRQSSSESIQDIVEKDTLVFTYYNQGNILLLFVRVRGRRIAD